MTAPGPQFSSVIPPGVDVMHSCVKNYYYHGCSDRAAVDRHLAVLQTRFLGPRSKLFDDPRARWRADLERLLDLRQLLPLTEKEAA